MRETILSRCGPALAGLVLWAGSFAPSVHAQCGPPGTESKLVASDGRGDRRFGSDVALSGDTALVAALGTIQVYVFVRDASGWSEQAILVGSDARPIFGSANRVALEGDVALIGDSLDDERGLYTGAVYVFVRSGTTWTQQAKLLASDGAAGDYFGGRVALSGNTALIGAGHDDDGGTDAGAAYVFVYDGVSWTQQAKLLASDARAEQLFGRAVDIDGDVAVIGAHADDVFSSPDLGAAYAFRRSGTTWSEEARLTSPDGQLDDRFGGSVAVECDRIAVGAQGHDHPLNATGAAYVYRVQGAAWTFEAELLASSAVAFTELGVSIALDAGVIVAGGLDEDGPGTARVFERVGATWTETRILAASDGATGDWFGVAVDLDGDTAIVGSIFADWVPSVGGIGAAYVYCLASPAAEADCGNGLDDDGDCQVDCADDDCSGAPGCNCPPPECRGITVVPAAPCAGDTVQLTLAHGPGVVTIEWDLDGDTVPDTGGNPVTNRFAAGSWNVTATLSDSCGIPPQTCTSSTMVVVSPLPAPVATAGEPTSFCAASGESVTLDAGAGFASYQWTRDATDIPGEMAQLLVVTASGAYAVRVTSAAGCTGASAPVAVDAESCSPPCAALTCGAVTITPSTACVGSVVQLEVVVTGGEGTVSVAWDLDGDTVADAFGNPADVTPTAGSWSVMATVADSCANPAPQSCTSGPMSLVVNPCIPGEVSDVRAGEPPLLLLKGSTSVRAELEPDAAVYNVYTGAIGSWRVPSPVSPAACHIAGWTDNGDGTVTFAHDLTVGSWMLVSASSPGGEGPVGRESTGADRALRGTWTRCGASP